MIMFGIWGVCNRGIVTIGSGWSSKYTECLVWWRFNKTDPTRLWLEISLCGMSPTQHSVNVITQVNSIKDKEEQKDPIVAKTVRFKNGCDRLLSCWNEINDMPFFQFTNWKFKWMTNNKLMRLCVKPGHMGQQSDKFKSPKLTSDIIKWITTDCRPVNIVENWWFQHIINAVHQLYQPPLEATNIIVNIMTLTKVRKETINLK